MSKKTIYKFAARLGGLLTLILLTVTITSYVGNPVISVQAAPTGEGSTSVQAAPAGEGGTSVQAPPAGEGSTSVQAAPAGEGADSSQAESAGDDQSDLPDNYLGGAKLMLLASATGGQNLSCVIQSKDGSVIVVDGGLKEDADHLVETIKSMGGKVSAWLITHPHSDHVGALTEILNRNPIPIEIDNVYYSFLERSTYEHGENMGRMGDLDHLLAAFKNLPQERLHSSLKKGQVIKVDDSMSIRVMNQPYRTLYNTFNNGSVAYRVDVGDKRILFLGDMGWQAGQNLLEKNKPEDLKADVVQMAHHGQDGVNEDVYRVINPEICLWPTPEWLWDNVKNGQPGAGPWKTLTVRKWMEDLGVKKNITVIDGDQTLQ